jgi:hypothetical protein
VKYWARLPLENFEQIQLEALTYVKSLGPTTNFWTTASVFQLNKQAPSINRSLLKHGLYMVYAAIITVPAPITPQIHIDDMLYTDGVLARLNIPLLNTVGSYTNFYTVPDGSRELRKNPNGIKYWYIDPAKAVLVSQVEATEPTILRISEPHAVYSKTNGFPRIVLSIRLNIDPVRYLDHGTF